MGWMSTPGIHVTDPFGAPGQGGPAAGPGVVGDDAYWTVEHARLPLAVQDGLGLRGRQVRDDHHRVPPQVPQRLGVAGAQADTSDHTTSGMTIVMPRRSATRRNAAATKRKNRQTAQTATSLCCRSRVN